MTSVQEWTHRTVRTGMEWAGCLVMGRLETGAVAAVPPAAEPGAPVVLVGGVAATMPVMAPTARMLAERGHHVSVVTEGMGVGCAGRAATTLADRVEACAEVAGRPVHLVGHSRGGQFARVAATHAPRAVASLTTLGSPLVMYGLAPVALGLGAVVTLGGTLGVPGLATVACLLGACCRDYRAALAADWAVDVPFTSIVGVGDRTVPGPANRVPHAREVVVDGDHLELLTTGPAHLALADALDRADQVAARSRISA
ncbi:esterase/lipase family protein [Actinomycetospora soli]|uniref:esterase/lipase family protein n=1 Tax=Actinomycetospora soli TaxID=2893887 RepID=UPI001E5814D2|nr:alpha/beta hydrolase [Actinomycetospora soli]MCD2186954.1 alpha/beta hydrolase [Actinomycetospora soli]